MKLPVLNNFLKANNKFGGFGGIEEDGLYDAINLVCSDKCHTRNARKAVMLYDTTPDQIIPCENRLFFRFGNTLKEVIKKPDGTLEENGAEYSLKNLNPSPDRKVILWEDEVYVLPDNIQVGVDKWYPFGTEYSSALAFPFVNARTLFYPNSFASSNYCPDAEFLRVGMKLRFSWVPSKVFTITTIEKKNVTYEEGVFEEGIRVTLDSNVSKYDSVPTNATAEYTNPQNRPILNDLVIGYNHSIYFWGESIVIYSVDSDYSFSLRDFFKEGQMVKISGSSLEENNATLRIIDISEHTLRFDREMAPIYEADKTIITITPIIPDFSHFLITEDRLFGIENSSGKFYISALKNPFLFYDKSTLKEDSWSVKINGNCTGIAGWKDNIICFTEDGGFRILGYHALNFGLRQLSLNGIKKGYGNTLVRVGDTLYYASEKGIMKYSGGSDKKISNSILKLTHIESTIADGTFVYMLSNNRIWVYDTEMERWWSEDAENITELFEFGGEKYLQSPGAIYVIDETTSTACKWSFELPFLKNHTSKKVIPLHFTLDYSSDTNCELSLYFRGHGQSYWQKCGSYNLENEGTIKIPLIKKHSKDFKIRVEGKGTFSPDLWCIYYKNT